jgi:hypothetical protein
MKNLIKISLFLFPFFASSQTIIKSDSIVFKQCNAIVVSSDLSNDDLYKICGNLLISNGLIISNASKDFYTINTNPKGEGLNWQFSVAIIIIDSKVKIRGFLSAQESNLTRTVRYPNGNFNYLQKIASQLSLQTKGKIVYLQESYEMLND